MSSKLVRLVVFLNFLLLLASCTRVNSGVGGVLNLDTDLRIEFQVANNINPDEKHSPSPVFVRLYELRSEKRFEQSDFFDLYQNDKAVLGDDLISGTELRRILPGSPRSETFVLNPETRYVALFAEFFQYKDADSKVVFAVTSNNVIKNTVQVKIEHNAITLQSPR